MTKETLDLLNACLPVADDVEAFHASAEQQEDEALKNLAQHDPIGCIFDCNSCPDFSCIANMAN